MVLADSLGSQQALEGGSLPRVRGTGMLELNSNGQVRLQEGGMQQKEGKLLFMNWGLYFPYGVQQVSERETERENTNEKTKWEMAPNTSSYCK